MTLPICEKLRDIANVLGIHDDMPARHVVIEAVAIIETLVEALEMCRWELNELAEETPGQTEARKAAEAALSKARGENTPGSEEMK